MMNRSFDSVFWSLTTLVVVSFDEGSKTRRRCSKKLECMLMKSFR
jgi:hypothetical protein